MDPVLMFVGILAILVLIFVVLSLGEWLFSDDDEDNEEGSPPRLAG